MIVSSTLLALAMMADAAVSSPTASKPTASADPMDKVVCRRTPVTGSLVSSKRVCLTKREWVAADEKGRKFAEEVVRDGNKGAVFQ
jgi:hypothetical protein